MTQERVGVTSYPLYWPIGSSRIRRPRRALFGDTNVYRESKNVRAEMERLRARKVVISSNLQLRQDGIPYANQRRPEDPGVAVWFELREKGGKREWREHVLACDMWDRPEHNLRAIVLHVAALRGQERWGVGSMEQAFAGYRALPAQIDDGRAWWHVLGVERSASREEIERAYRLQARSCHPDHGGSAEAFVELDRARRQALDAAAAGGP